MPNSRSNWELGQCGIVVAFTRTENHFFFYFRI